MLESFVITEATYLIYPAVFVGLLYILNIILFFKKRNATPELWVEVQEDIRKYPIVKLLPLFVIFASLMSASAVYAVIVYMQLWTLETQLDTQIQMIFLGLIAITILLHSIIFFVVLKFLNKGKNYNKCLSMGILWIAMTEAPAIIGLVLIFDAIGKIS